MDNEERIEAIRAKQEDYTALWEQVRRFVRQQAARYHQQNRGLCAGAGVELEDLLQTGFLALYDAVQGFDAAAGCSFIGYFALYLKRYFRAACGIRTSKRDPLNACSSLDAPLAEESDGGTLADILPDEAAQADMDAALDAVYSRQLWQDVQDIFRDAPEAAAVVLGRFRQGKTLDALAQETGKSRHRICLLEERALSELRKPKNLRRLAEEASMRRTFAWRGTGFADWYHTGASAVERAAEKLEQKRAGT